MIVTLLAGAISMGVVYLYACLGETIIEKIGNLNLGIPGIMSLGALGGALGVVIYTKIFGEDNYIGFVLILFALVFSVLVAALGGLIYSFLTVSLQANQNVTGLALTTFGVGTMKFFGSTMDITNFATASKYFGQMFKFADKLGWFGEIFLSHGPLVYLSFILAIVTGLIINKTKTSFSLLVNIFDFIPTPSFYYIPKLIYVLI